MSTATAVYVMLDSGALEGYFRYINNAMCCIMVCYSDNGFTMRPNVVYDMYFTAWSDITVSEFTANINTRYIITYNISVIL